MMSMFEDIIRPRAETKVINQFIEEFKEAKAVYKEKNYKSALELFEKSYNTLEPIFDEYPKTENLYYLMKTKYHCKLYNHCLATKNILKNSLNKEIKIQRERSIIFISKIFFYEIIISNIKNELKESIQKTLELIEFIKENFTVDEKVDFFRRFLNDFLKIGGVNKTKKYELFKQEYDNMLVETSDTGEEHNFMIKARMKEIFKNFFSTKIRKTIFDVINNEFYNLKYHVTYENKIVNFLDQKMNICVRDNNTLHLIEIFQTYLNLNKLAISTYFGKMTMKNLINEQKNRIEAFDTIFGNICGGFNYIFGEYLTENYTDQLLQDSFYKKSSKNIKKMKRTLSNAFASKSDLSSQAKEIFEQIKNNHMVIDTNPVEVKKHPTRFKCDEFDFEKDVKIPPNVEYGEDNTSHFEVSLPTQNTRPSTTKVRVPKLYRKKTETDPNEREKVPEIRSKENDKQETTASKIQTSPNTSSVMITKTPKFKLRNINNFLMNTLIKQFSNYIYLRKSDMIDVKIDNFIKNYGSATDKGSGPENQDVLFCYENFLLIKGFTVFGVCDGHGKNGRLVAEGFKKLFPSYMHYLTMDNNLIRRGEEINEIVISLFKLEERPEVKELNIIRYFYKKFDMIYDYIPFVKKNMNLIKEEITEAFGRSHSDLKNRLKIDTETSGSTVAAMLIYGKIIYCVNLGDSRIIVGRYLKEIYKWEYQQLTTDHNPRIPTEAKRINAFGGRVDRMKADNGDPVGPYRVWFKPNDSVLPGLAMSRSIGDSEAKKIGVTFEPDVSKYILKEKDRFFLIASDGLFEYLTAQEIVNIIGDFYGMKDKAENAAKKVVEKARERAEEKNAKTIDDISCWVIFFEVQETEKKNI